MKAGSGDDAARWRRSRVRLYVAGALLDVVTPAYAIAVYAYAQHRLGATPAELGLLGAAIPGAYAAGCALTGAWSDRRGSIGFMRGSLAALLVVVPATLVAARLGSVGILFVAHAVYGLAISLFWPPLLRQLSLLSPGRTLWMTLGVFNFSWAAGSACGSYGGPVLFADVGWTGTLWILTGLVLATLGILSWRSPRGPAGSGGGLDPPVEPRKGILFLRLAWMANFCASFAMGAVTNLMVYVGERRGYSLYHVGLLLFAKDFGRFAAFIAFRYYAGWHYSLPWLVVGQAVGGAALILAGASWSIPLLIVLVALLGAFNGLSYYSSLYYGLNLRSGEGKKSGLHETILAMGWCLGPLVCGGVGALVPAWPGIVFVASGALVFAGLAVQVAVYAARSR